MDWQAFETWLSRTNLILVAAILLGAMFIASAVGVALRTARDRRQGATEDDQEGYVVSAVLGLLALLLGFTFSLAVDRFDARRLLVLDEANAIGTTYLRAQLLTEPHRARMSEILIQYTDNRIALAKAMPGSAEQQQLLKTDDTLVTDIWAATSAAFESIKGLDFSSAYLDSVNALIDLDASRKTAQVTRVPIEVFAVLFVYLVMAAAVLGYVLNGAQGRAAAASLMMLLTLCLLLIIDINRPVLGGISESQRPMEELRKSLVAQPPEVFNKWR